MQLTETLGCITGMRFSSMNSVPSCAYDDGDNHSIPARVKVAFTAENLPNPLIIFTPSVEVD